MIQSEDESKNDSNEKMYKTLFTFTTFYVFLGLFLLVTLHFTFFSCLRSDFISYPYCVHILIISISYDSLRCYFIGVNSNYLQLIHTSLLVGVNWKSLFLCLMVSHAG